MSRNYADGVLRLDLSTAWIDLPGPDDDAAAGIAEIVASFSGVADEARVRLAHALAVVQGIAARLPAGSRRSSALILSPESGRVDALLSIRASRVTANAYDNYLEAATGYTGDGVDALVNRVVEELELPNGRAILSRDYQLPANEGGVPAPATERAFLALFLSESDTAVELMFMTQNLALLDDARSFLVALASGEKAWFAGEEGR